MQEFGLVDFLTKFAPHKEDISRITNLYNLLPKTKDFWLAGGAIRRAILGHKIDSDWDFFFKSKESFDNFIAWIKNSDSFTVSKEVKNTHNTTLLVSAKCSDAIVADFTIQLINIQYYETIDSLLDSFDFTLCQFATDGEKLYCGPYSLYNIGSKKLVVHKITYPVASLRRLLKYTNQGFYACGGCLKDLLDSVAKNPTLLEQDFKYID